jgi:hypothetical protein
VTVDRNRIAPDGAPNVVEIAFRYFEPSEASWTESGYTSCQIDLNKQHDLEPVEHQPGPMRPLMHGKLGLMSRRARETPKPPGEKWSDFWTSLYRRLDRQEMARQWAQSQVIPGYIFDAEAAAADRPIDAVVIFGGSADYALLLQGVRGGPDGLNRLKIRRPNGVLQFVDCG